MDEDACIITLTDEQFAMVSRCIEHISAYEREFDEEDERVLKRVAEIFGAEYIDYREDETNEEED